MEDNEESRSALPRPPAPGTLRIVPLGGLGEVGMNCLALEEEEGIVLVDCGVTFPNNDLGIDVLHPRFDYLLERRARVHGIVVTHGHEDHIGAIPYLLRDLPLPVYGPAHALELVRQRLAEHRFGASEVRLVPTAVGERFDVGPFEFEGVRVTHSITDATALAIDTVAGTVIHTGDFKMDPSPPDGEPTDEARLAALGDAGVRLLLSDSTNVDSPGVAGGERDVGEALAELVAKAKGRVVVGLFASNVQRLQLLCRIGLATGRRICLLGRGVNSHVRAAALVGRLGYPSDLLVSPDIAARLPRAELLVLAGGTQAEPLSSLTRLAQGTHQALRLVEGDVVILSSRIIPGNDRPVSDMVCAFLRAGIEVVSRATDRRVHVSGHAHRDEQRRMIELTRPRAFVPLHGTLHHLMRHAALAEDAGVPEVLVVENGQTVELMRDTPVAKGPRVPAGRVATFGGAALSDDLLRDRAKLGRGGIAFVAVTLNAEGKLRCPPAVVARGVVDAGRPEVLRGASIAAARAIEECGARIRASDEPLANVIRLAVRSSIEAATGRRPLVVVTLARC